jgi:two-component system nitrogen regulation response regulator GlnG
MKRYRWPGNIREVENLIRRLAALYPQELVTDQLVETELGMESPVLPPRPAPRQDAPAHAATHDDHDTLSLAVEHHLLGMFKEYGEQLPPPGLYHRVLREIEYPLISAALAATRGNQIRAAELLGLNRNTLRKKVRDLDIRLMRSPR